MNDERLQELLEGFHDNTLSEDECRELTEWFDEDESRLSDFANELRSGNALAALHVFETDSLPHAVKDGLQRANREFDISQSVRQQIEGGAQSSSVGVGHSRQPHTCSNRWRSVTAAAMAVLALFTILQEQPDSNHDDVVAMVQNARQVQEVSAGDELRSGQVLELVDGRVTINFQSGARLAVQAPAELKLLGPNSAELQRGVATVRVPGEIKGFVLVTPHQRVTDLGTSFGVDVDRTGDTAITVFEGEIELEDKRRLVGGQTVTVAATDQTTREVPYVIDQFLNTWQVSFGVEQIMGDVRVASPSERYAPGIARDSDSLLLFPEREDALLKSGYVVDGLKPGTYQRPFRKHTVKLKKDVRVDSFLLQYNPGNDDVPGTQKLQGELHFDRSIVGVILQKNLLDSSDAQLALPDTDFRDIFRRGINTDDVITLSADRRVLHVSFNVSDGVDQIRVLVAADNSSSPE